MAVAKAILQLNDIINIIVDLTVIVSTICTYLLVMVSINSTIAIIKQYYGYIPDLFSIIKI